MGNVHRPIDLEYKKIGAGKWRKWNPVFGLYSTLEAIYDSSGKKTAWRVTYQQPQQLLDAIIERNVAMQNSWKGKYGSDVITQTTSLPIVVHNQLMEQCGFQKGHGYDEKKFRQILNDRDNYKLKTVPGRI